MSDATIYLGNPIVDGFEALVGEIRAFLEFDGAVVEVDRPVGYCLEALVGLITVFL